jgi:glutamyl-tRNA reductase
MKVYFSAPISRVPDEIKTNYSLIINALKKLGHNVISENLTDKSAETLKKQTPEEALEIQHQMTKRKNQADIVILEVSTPSFGIGQELAYSLQNNKQVIVLYREGHDPHLLRDEGMDLLFIHSYTPDNIAETLSRAIEEAREKMDVRFNFYISPEISRYLDWISQTKKIPRSVYLRSLLERQLRSDKDFKG